MFLACEDEDVLGSTYGLLDPDESGAWRVGGMWVGPAWRRRGIARALLQAAHDPTDIALYVQAGSRDFNG